MNHDLRIGLGIDLHRLEKGRPCILAGVRIDSELGPQAVSDGDAVLHAAVDAVLGAAGLDDLGTLFPENDPKNQDRDSAEFCKRTLALIHEQGLRVVSLDVVVETEVPKLRAHRPAMRRRLAALFDVPADRVNIKGKTNEGLDAIGAKQAIRATVVALLASQPPAHN
ncbi:2-C-methyl-D-erythritol 2,4-cyclodiphosphate synthase [Planctomycetota bacterium]|nr:2-C-methyl-D-erythritol 2,4-cyclodiphosphate synthase [Planctomycetota bacterium]GDY03042.1 2-C-methyl-D-erythritol 2,4-cyclodiphosphate synthase [Planctomycetota bacterium]